MMMMMMIMKMMKMMLVVCVFVTLGGLAPALGGEHSLYYTYTALSKPLNLPGVYEFTALGMLNDRELDYYSSETQAKTRRPESTTHGEGRLWLTCSAYGMPQEVFMPTEPDPAAPRHLDKPWLTGCALPTPSVPRLPTVSVKVNGHPVTALLDSGSTITLVWSPSFHAPKPTGSLKITCTRGRLGRVHISQGPMDDKEGEDQDNAAQDPVGDAGVTSAGEPNTPTNPVSIVSTQVIQEGNFSQEQKEDPQLKNYWSQKSGPSVNSVPSAKRQPHEPAPAPLIPLPIIGMPFERIGMDLIGLLPKSARGHELILVIVDYATRYPEAVPL
ncbi:hypothetical protein PDJAM_G00248160 [Pangasius djambal]|uniref:Uncharacterized protein n=1 Tax=Pangasius djambal TaxID=1691987 RepID=A0ACC5YIT8_9TELE|nr:hypothetical protein [Pangasius djambal]